MPPKKGGGGAGKKAVQAKKEKIIEDKTFGLKNKNKSKVVQTYIKQVEKTVLDAGSKKKPRDMLEPVLSKKDRDAEMQREMAALFKPIQISQKAAAGVDPKSMVCEFFKAGICTKGQKCKFSHDLEVARKVEKIDLYSDQRNEEGMDNWDQTTLENCVNQKDNRTTTEIVCKYFLEAIETKKYGWFWTCPNEQEKGKSCMYRHKLPPGFVLKSVKKKQEADSEANEVPIEEIIEQQRSQIETRTPITAESFKAWKEKKAKEKVKAEASAKKEEERKLKEARKTKVASQMSGRALFAFDPTLFVDDDDAADQTEMRVEEDAEDVLEIQAGGTSISFNVIKGSGATATEDADGGEGGAAGGGEAITIQENLFLAEEELPDDDEDD